MTHNKTITKKQQQQTNDTKLPKFHSIQIHSSFMTFVSLKTIFNNRLPTIKGMNYYGGNDCRDIDREGRNLNPNKQKNEVKKD